MGPCFRDSPRGQGLGLWECSVGSVPRTCRRMPEQESITLLIASSGDHGEEKLLFASPPTLLRREVWPLARFSVSQPRPLMLLPAPMIMRKVELAPLLRCDGCLDNAPIMAAIAAAR